MNNLKWLAVVPAALAVVFLLVGLTWTEWPQFLLGVGLLGLAAWRVASLVCIAPADPGVTVVSPSRLRPFGAGSRQLLASLPSHRPTTREWNSGCGTKPREA